MTLKKPELNGLTVLVLDSDIASLNSIEQELEGTGADVLAAKNLSAARDILRKKHVEVLVAAIELVDEQCIEMVKDYKARHPGSLFYVLTERRYENVESSLESVRLVVDDYIRKPLDAARFAAMVGTGIGRPGTESRSLAVIDPLINTVKPYFIFRSPVMRKTLAHLPQIASSEQTVLITGETGTGKEVIARAIHVMSQRSSGPFVPINCGAIPESLIEGELFGHEKGAFTGATTTRKGKFEAADNGTLFLDEIGDMPLNLQVRLLRVLEERKVYRVGGTVPVAMNVRVIAASNTDLGKAVKNGLFRDDLYYRLNVLRLHLPPLKERPDDIPLLAVHFLRRAFAEMNWDTPYPDLSPETISILEQYPWTGNVRELRNVMTRVATLLPRNTKKIFPFHILSLLDESSQKTGILPGPETDRQNGIFIPDGTTIDEAENLLMSETLKKTGGNRTRAASLLGISIRTLRRKLNK